jgi:hypothetical protein
MQSNAAARRPSKFNGIGIAGADHNRVFRFLSRLHGPELPGAGIGLALCKKAFKSEKIIFAQGDSADAIFYIQKGKVKLTVLSKRGKEAVIAVLGPCGFFGEGCLAGQSVRMSTVTPMTDCSIMRLTRATVIETLRKAEMVGTTRSRVSFFMNKFRRLDSLSTTARWKFIVRY